MKNKKWLAFALLSAMCAFVGATACNDNKGENSSSNASSIEESASAGETENIAIAFTQSVYSLYQYDTLALYCNVAGSDAAPVFASSNPNVLTVDEQGVVTAVNVGKATVSATIGNTQATCEVTVMQSPYAPEIQVDRKAITLEKGGSYSMSVSTLWNKKEVAEQVDYTWTYAEGASQILSVSQNDDGMVTFTGLSIGVTEMYVSATVRGIYVNQKVTFEVIAQEVVIQSDNTAIVPVAGGYSASVATANIAGNSNEISLDFLVCKGSEVVNTNILWQSGDEEKLTVAQKDGKWYAVGVSGGKAELVGSTTVDGEDVSVTVYVDVYLPDVRLTQTATLEVERLENLVIEEDILGTVQSVELDGVVISQACAGKTITLNKDVLPKVASKLGVRDIIVSTNLVRYTMSVELYTLIIRNKDDLDSMSAIAEANGQAPCEFEGYFLLGNDIAYNGLFIAMTDSGYHYMNNKEDGGWSNMTKGFKGIFDGRGYNIDGLEVGDRITTGIESGGIFGYLGSGGIVRNVSFTNATVQENCGFICSFGDGLIENVSITFKQLGVGLETRNLDNATLPRCMGAFFCSQSGVNAMVRNCVVDASNAEIMMVRSTVTGNTNIRLTANSDSKKNGNVKMENVITICPNLEVLVDAGSDVKVETFEELAKNPAFAEALKGDVWTSVNGIPMFKNLVGKLDLTKEISFTKGDNVVYAGTTMDIAVDEYYAYVVTDSLPDGVTYSDGKLSIGADVEGCVFALKAVSLLNGSEATLEITVKQIVETTVDVARINIEKRTGTIDLSSVSAYLGEKTSVYLGETELGKGSGLVLDINWDAITQYGETTFTVISENDLEAMKFDIPVFAVTMMIKTAEEFVENITKADKAQQVFNGYYMLANDIDCTGYEFNGIGYIGGAAWDKNFGFRGTLDGNGKKFYKVLLGGYANGNNGGMFGMIGAGGVIKNVTFDVTYKARYAATLFGGSILNAELTDVTINVVGYEHLNGKDTTVRKTENVNRKNSLLASSYINYTTIKNLTINAAEFDIYSLITIKMVNTTFENCEITAKSYHFIASTEEINDTSVFENYMAEDFSANQLKINGTYVPVSFE